PASECSRLAHRRDEASAAWARFERTARVAPSTAFQVARTGSFEERLNIAIVFDRIRIAGFCSHKPASDLVPRLAFAGACFTAKVTVSRDSMLSYGASNGQGDLHAQYPAPRGMRRRRGRRPHGARGSRKRVRAKPAGPCLCAR